MSYHSIVSTELAVALVTLPRITSSDLYERCKNLIGNTPIVKFKSELSKWLSDGTIPGYETRKGIHGGIYKKGAPNDVSKITTKIKLEKPTEDLTESVSEVSFVLEISPTLRITQSDHRNWVIQKKSGDNGWQNKYYHNKLSSMIASAIHHIINDEFKIDNDTVMVLSNFEFKLEAMEKKLILQLQEAINKIIKQ